jgi:hypothetical protein
MQDCCCCFFGSEADVDADMKKYEKYDDDGKGVTLAPENNQKHQEAR